MIQNPFYRIDPFSSDLNNIEFNKKPESIHVTKKKEKGPMKKEKGAKILIGRGLHAPMTVSDFY